MPYPIYRTPPTADRLAQGDILSASQLAPSLRGHQDYFADGQHFYRYVVLTQTCDLVPEQGYSDYICLAVVRKLADLIGRRHVENGPARKTTQGLLKDLYLHNYHRRGLFYLPADPHFGIEAESAADLRVVFSLHKLHYPSLISARLVGVTDLYAAKLGHMVGHLFSRVATPGWKEVNSEVKLETFARSAVENFRKHEDAEFEKLVAIEGPQCSAVEPPVST